MATGILAGISGSIANSIAANSQLGPVSSHAKGLLTGTNTKLGPVSQAAKESLFSSGMGSESIGALAAQGSGASVATAETSAGATTESTVSSSIRDAWEAWSDFVAPNFNDPTSYGKHFWESFYGTEFWTDWHIDIGFSYKSSSSKLGISHGIKIDIFKGKYYYYSSPGVKGNSFQALIVSGKATPGYSINVWTKYGNGIFGSSLRTGINGTLDATWSYGTGIRLSRPGFSWSAGPRYVTEVF